VHYYINTTAPYADQAIGLLSDWMQNAVIDEKEFAREHDVIKREFDMGRGEPDRIFWKLTQAARYKAHPARHPTIGYYNEYLAVARDQVISFYKRMYVPNNMVFVVVGDIDKQKVVDQITQLWKDMQVRDLPKITFPVEPEIESPRFMEGEAAIHSPRLRLAWPATQLGEPGDWALDLLSVILGQGESSRLVRTVRDEQRLVNTIDAYNASFPWGKGFFGIDAEVAVPPSASSDPVAVRAAVDAAVERTKAAVLDQVGRLLSSGVTEEELARAKRQTIAHVVISAQTAQGLADRLARDIIGMDDPDYLQKYAKGIQDVTAAQVQAAADRFLNRHQLITVVLRPQQGNTPPEHLVRAKDEVDVSTLPKEDVQLDNVVILDKLRAMNVEGAARSIDVEPVLSYKLPNGLRVLVGRSTAVPAASVQLFQLGGLLADAPGKEGVANAAAAMQLRGTKSRTANQIAQQIEDLGASLDTNCGYSTQYASAVCLKDDLPKIIELMADVTLNPTYPQDEWSKLQPRLVAAIKRRTDQWYGELQTHFRADFFDHHPWSQTTLGREDVVKSLTVADLDKFHRDHLGASETVLAVFGDVDPQAVAKLAEQYFAAMPSAPPKPFTAPGYEAPTAGVRQYKTDKPLAAVQIGFGPGVTRRNPDYAAIQVLVRVLSNFPSGWLDQALRGEGPGLVYAVWAYQFTGMARGYVSMAFNTDPTRAPESLRRAMAVANRARTELVSDDDLARAKAAVMLSEFLTKQTNSQRATEAALDELYGLGNDASGKFVEEVQRLDADYLRVVAQTYLRNPVSVIITNQPAPMEELKAAATLEAAPASK
jgi:zinc protease